MGSDFMEMKEKRLPGPERLETEEGKYGASQLQQLLQDLMAGKTPTQGIAGMTPGGGEDLSQQLLASFLKPGGSAQSMLEKTLVGGYTSPETNPAYQSLLAEQQRTQGSDLATIGRQAQLGGMLGSTGRIGAQSDYLAQAGGQRLGLLGQIMENERSRQMQASSLLPQLQSQQIGTGMQYGGLQRQLDQAKMDAAYQQAMMKYTGGGQLAQGLMSYSPFYQPQFAQQPSKFQNLMLGLKTTADLVNAFSGGGAKGAAAAGV